MTPGGGRFGDWGEGPKFEGEPWIVHYTAYHPAGAQQGRIRMWVKTKEDAIARVKAQGQRRGIHITIWNVYRPGRTPAGLHVPEGMEEVQ